MHSHCRTGYLWLIGPKRRLRTYLLHRPRQPIKQQCTIVSSVIVTLVIFAGFETVEAQFSTWPLKHFYSLSLPLPLSSLLCALLTLCLMMPKWPWRRFIFPSHCCLRVYYVSLYLWAAEVQGSEDCAQHLRRVASSSALPPQYWLTLQCLLRHLARVCQASAANLLNARALAEIFGPMLFRQQAARCSQEPSSVKYTLARRDEAKRHRLI